MQYLTDEDVLGKAQAACKRSNRAFYMITYTFPKEKRNAILFVYYYLRTLDDLVDRKGISEAARIKTLREHKKKMDMLYRGEIPNDMSSADRALQNFILHDPAAARAVRQQIENFFTTMEFDSKNKHKLISYKDLIRYCYLTGGSPFVLVLSLLDPRIDRKTKENIARTLGVGINLTHILRDFRADLKVNDIKVTPDERNRFNLFGAKIRNNDALRPLARERVEEAANLLSEGRKYIMKVDNFMLRMSLLLFRWKYLSILRRVKLRNYDLMSDYGKVRFVERVDAIATLMKELLFFARKSLFRL